MGFLSPLFLVGILAAAIPIALHLFRQQAGPVVPFSAVRFVPRVPLHRTRRRQLQDVFLLALRVAAVVLLAVSFARPYLSAAPAERNDPLTIIAVDRSYSMSAPGLMDAARDAAESVVRELGAGELVAVLAFDERADVLHPPTPDRSAARSAIAGITSGFGATRYDAALARGVELAAGRPARLVLVSDLQRNGWPDGVRSAIPETMALETRRVDGAPANLLVSAVRGVERGIAAEIRNTAPRDRTVRATLSIDGRTVAEERVTVPAGGATPVTFLLPLPPRGAAAVRVEDDAGYAADDVRYLVLDAPPPRRVLAVVNPNGESEALYFSKAVAAADPSGALVVETLGADAIGARRDALDGYEAIVLLGARGFDERAGEALGRALDRGSGLILAAGPSLDLQWLAGRLPQSVRVRASGVETIPASVSLAPTDIRHPVFQLSRGDSGWIGAARFGRILRLSPGEEARVLARFTNGAPALLELKAASARVLVFASDLANQWNDLPLQPAFVPFVHALVQYVSPGRPPLREVHVGARPGPQWAQPGVIRESPDDPGSPRVAINVDLRESDAAQMTHEEFVAAVERRPSVGQGNPDSQARAREAEQSWWWYGLLLMLAGLIIESAAGRVRRSGAEA
ncbi:MAG TPA: BatA domain-containing protein [Vicinamibacterales bacterium]|nr:BatA domain-containing protein [Vicinamibacterales bacterium]